MNTLTLNNISLDGGNIIIKKGNSTGGGNNGSIDSVSKGDVTFYDYDGTVLHSYTKNEFLALSAMPELPSRQGLICQEWNWSFEDSIAYVSEYGILDVGATYITDDGKTRLYIRIAAKGRMDVPLYFSQTVANGVVIDWGDGSETQTLSGKGYVNTTHKYAEIGDYVITLDPVEGCTLGQGVTSLFGNNIPAIKWILQKAEIGKAVDNVRMFKYRTLDYITIPNTVTVFNSEDFYEASSLRCLILPRGITTSLTHYLRISYVKTIVLPSTITSFGAYAFASDPMLMSIVIPNSVTSIGKNAFYHCESLTSIVIPNSVTSIETNAFNACVAIAFFDFSKHTMVPTLSATNAFQAVASDCKIIVPDALYNEWIAATNWSTSSIVSMIIKKSDWDASQA